MEYVQFIQKFFILLIPGMISLSIYHFLNPHKERHYYVEFLTVLVISFFSFATVDLIFLLIKCVFPMFLCNAINIILYISSSINSTSVSLPLPNFITSLIISIAVALIGTKMNYTNVLFRIANKLKLTNRTDNTDVWEQMMKDMSFVVVRDYKTNQTYYGQVVGFSDNCERRELRLIDVNVFDSESNHLYHAKELYISRNHDEISIETYNFSASEGDINDAKPEQQNEKSQSIKYFSHF